MTPQPEFIYHLVREGHFPRQCKEGFYVPASFQQDGFIHCTCGEEMTMQVAQRIFPGAKDVLLLRIRLSRLHAEVKFQRAASEGGESPHADHMFAHIYGALNLDAVEVARVTNTSMFPDFA